MSLFFSFFINFHHVQLDEKKTLMMASSAEKPIAHQNQQKQPILNVGLDSFFQRDKESTKHQIIRQRPWSFLARFRQRNRGRENRNAKPFSHLELLFNGLFFAASCCFPATSSMFSGGGSRWSRCGAFHFWRPREQDSKRESVKP